MLFWSLQTLTRGLLAGERIRGTPNASHTNVYDGGLVTTNYVTVSANGVLNIETDGVVDNSGVTLCSEGTLNLSGGLLQTSVIRMTSSCAYTAGPPVFSMTGGELRLSEFAGRLADRHRRLRRRLPPLVQ